MGQNFEYTAKWTFGQGSRCQFFLGFLEDFQTFFLEEKFGIFTEYDGIAIKSYANFIYIRVKRGWGLVE